MSSRDRVDRAWVLVQFWAFVFVAHARGRVDGYALAKKHEEAA